MNKLYCVSAIMATVVLVGTMPAQGDVIIVDTKTVPLLKPEITIQTEHSYPISSLLEKRYKLTYDVSPQ